MKKLLMSAVLAITLVANNGCSSKKDSNEAAKDINETKINDDATTGAQGASEGDQKDESVNLVDLSDTRLAKYELSKVAVDRATNPRVKTFARELVAGHTADEKGIRDMAFKKQLTLPTTLSKTSQGMLADLVDEKAGKDFDKKYLDQIADITSKAIDKARGVRDNTESIEMKNVASKIMADAEIRKAQADKLEAIL